MRLPDLDPNDFSDAAARGLLQRISVLLRQEARDDWRPDVLELATEPWLEEPVGRVRALLDDLRRLTDVQIAAEAQRVARQLRLARLDIEVAESMVLLEEAEPDEAAQIRVAVAEKNRERAAVWRADAEAGGGKLGTRTAIIPSRFRLPIDQLAAE
jgi:hypothetical protein